MSPKPDLTVVGPEPVFYRIPEAVTVLNLSRSVVYELIRSGRLKTVKEGRTRLVPASAIADYVALLIRESGVTADGEAA